MQSFVFQGSKLSISINRKINTILKPGTGGDSQKPLFLCNPWTFLELNFLLYNSYQHPYSQNKIQTKDSNLQLNNQAGSINHSKNHSFFCLVEEMWNCPTKHV